MSEVRQRTTGLKRGLNRFVIAAVLAWGCTVAVTAARAPADSGADSARRAGGARKPTVTDRAAARGAGAAAPTLNAPPQGAPAERLTGSVVSVDVTAGTFDLVTGVGYALRIRRVHLPPERKLETRRAATAMPAPGSVVRVELQHTARGALASSVEVILIPPREEKP